MSTARLRWSVPADGADVLAATPAAIYAISGEVASAFATRTGEHLWTEIIPDVSGEADLAVTADLLIVRSDWEDPVGLDPATGEIRDLEGRDDPVTHPRPSTGLPRGYSFESGIVRYDGLPVWAGADERHPPMVFRHREVTVVALDGGGVQAVDDTGELLLRIVGDDPQYTAALVSLGDTVVVAGGDGVLHRIDLG